MECELGSATSKLNTGRCGWQYSSMLIYKSACAKFTPIQPFGLQSARPRPIPRPTRNPGGPVNQIKSQRDRHVRSIHQVSPSIYVHKINVMSTNTSYLVLAIFTKVLAADHKYISIPLQLVRIILINIECPGIHSM